MKKKEVILIRQDTPKPRLSPARLKRWIRGMLRALQITGAEVHLWLVSDSKMSALNKEFLRHSGATDVITFGQCSRKDGRKTLWANLVISLDTTKRQAREYGNSFDYELAFYICHGLLHVLGGEDRTLAERKKMWKKQEQILKTIKVRSTEHGVRSFV